MFNLYKVIFLWAFIFASCKQQVQISGHAKLFGLNDSISLLSEDTEVTLENLSPDLVVDLTNYSQDQVVYANEEEAQRFISLINNNFKQPSDLKLPTYRSLKAISGEHKTDILILSDAQPENPRSLRLLYIRENPGLRNLSITTSIFSTKQDSLPIPKYGKEHKLISIDFQDWITRFKQKTINPFVEQNRNFFDLIVTHRTFCSCKEITQDTCGGFNPNDAASILGIARPIVQMQNQSNENSLGIIGISKNCPSPEYKPLVGLSVFINKIQNKFIAKVVRSSEEGGEIFQGIAFFNRKKE